MSDRYANTYFGACPECGGCDGYLNLAGGQHVFACRAHRTKWLAGKNLFPSCERETEDSVGESRRMIEGFRAVEPIYPMGNRGMPGGALVECVDDAGFRNFLYPPEKARP